MLIRHISLPRNSHLRRLNQPTQRTEEDQPTDYSNHLNRTLNPERPANHCLVDHFSPKKAHPKKQTSKALFQTFSQPQFLIQQYPLTLEEFTNAPLSPQQTQQPKIKVQPEVKTRNLYRIKQNWSTLSPHLNNNAYLRSDLKFEDQGIPSFQSVKNKPYINKEHRQLKELDHLLLPKDNDQEIDEGIVNIHSKIHSNKGELYKTLNRFREKKLLNDHNTPLVRQKKYNFSLPKEPQHKQWYSNQSLLEDKNDPLQMRKTKKDSFKLSEKQKSAFFPEYSKKRVIPADAEEKEERKQLIFDATSTNKIKRRASEQQSTINVKPMYQAFKTNKIKKRNSAFDFNSQKRNLSQFFHQNIEISYRMSLPRLKQICSNPHLNHNKVIIKIPEIFSYPLFTGQQKQQELFSKAAELVKNLQIQSKSDISIKKYTNCILIVAGNLAVIWHYTGKVYFGGWQYHILDEGTKTGLGLEWSPNKYVYYGQFSKNKREGAGIMKNNSNQILAGRWRQNKFLNEMAVNVQKQVAAQCESN